MKNAKWGNYGLWAALGSLAVMALNDFAHIAPAQSEPYVDAILLVLAAAGVVSNPKEGRGFSDK